MEKYEPQKIEKKWQKKWEKQKLYQAKDFSKKPKKYILIEFPYPSGQGLHVGHCRSYSALDAVARKKRMEGFNVLFPIGWDAFGLPAENFAIKAKVHPQETTRKNIANYKKQMKSLGFSFDWTREINTTDPKYYKWTQWIFLQLFKKGLAYQAEIPINWCPVCKIGLANEEVVGGKCERCNAQVEKKIKKQWLLRITKYADRLIDDLEKVDYLEKVKAQQINWIGKSCGAEIKFPIINNQLSIKVFTTRLDTIFGCTYMVVAPEHEIISELANQILNLTEVKKYVRQAKRKSDLERTELVKEKTGVELKGIKAINPFNQEKIPVWVADYVLPHYGTGAIMAVPFYDERDLEFAKKNNIAVKKVSLADQEKLLNQAKKQGFGKKAVHYKLRDWIFSRQHYWGEPIPIIHCKKCGAVPVSEKDLPIKLPYIEKYQPTKTGESPLAKIDKWVDVKCPKCKSAAKRETDTMPNWAGSSWYFMRYIDPNNNKVLADSKKLKYWMPVDWYNGGFEHTTLHLLYSRFWYKFLYDIGVAPQKEPYSRRTSHGIVLAEDHRKMSKSFGNVINPDDIIQKYGADALRLYEMFMGPFDQAIIWNEKGLVGMRRFLEKVWNLFQKAKTPKNAKLEKLLHQTIKKVTEDIENFKFNTAISQLMILVNEMERQNQLPVTSYQLLLKLLAPMAPHISEEIWYQLGHKKSIFEESWPKYDDKLIKEERITLVIQVNGKVRDKIEVETGISEEQAKKLTLEREKVKKWIQGKKIKKMIFIKGKLINIVC
ncbi:leucine--tRNA ligase [Candidatus Parcubacteria bacterium]|nr:leucine--tRNA ligase [Candidatus Parcubacteria bacterium]